jgi:hypothetical protein
MKAALQEQQGSESAHHLPTCVLPQISYTRALNSHFTFCQVAYTIRKCPGDIFKQFIEQCSQASLGKKNWKLLQHINLLLMLDKDCSEVTRWYAVELLLEQKVPVPLEQHEEAHP